VTSDEIRAFVHDHIRVWVARDVDALLLGYHENCQLVSPMFRNVRGKAGIEASFRELFRAFGEWVIQIDELLIDHEAGDRCAFVSTVNASQTGEIFGVPGSGRRFELRAFQLLHFEDGKIIAEQRLYDFSGMLMQLGILKAKPS